MLPSQRFVVRLPLQELWDDQGRLALSRLAPVGKGDIQQLMREGVVRFVVADVGSALRWVALADCFRLWKEEVRPHLAEGDRLVPEAFPGEYCYAASRWATAAGEPPVVLLEKHH